MLGRQWFQKKSFLGAYVVFSFHKLENVTKSILVSKDSPRSAVNFASSIAAAATASVKNPGKIDIKPLASHSNPVTAQAAQPVKNPKSDKIELPLKLPFLDLKASQEEAKKSTQESMKKNVEFQKVLFHFLTIPTNINMSQAIALEWATPEFKSNQYFS